MRMLHRSTGELIDPHSAVGIGAGLEAQSGNNSLAVDSPLVCLATAHPAKFPDAVSEACGVKPALPAHLADLFERPERMDAIPADASHVKEYVRSFVESRLK
jgi:threonine synthase